MFAQANHARLADPFPIPKGFNVLSDGSHTVISQKWISPSIWLPLSLNIIPFAFQKMHDESLVLHSVAALFLIYYIISIFINKTEVILSLTQLRRVTRPLPWIDNVTINASNLVSFSTRFRWGSGSSYDVFYIDTRNRELEFFSDLSEAQADFLSKSLTRFYCNKKSSPGIL